MGVPWLPRKEIEPCLSASDGSRRREGTLAPRSMAAPDSSLPTRRHRFGTSPASRRTCGPWNGSQPRSSRAGAANEARSWTSRMPRISSTTRGKRPIREIACGSPTKRSSVPTTAPTPTSSSRRRSQARWSKSGRCTPRASRPASGPSASGHSRRTSAISGGCSRPVRTCGPGPGSPHAYGSSVNERRPWLTTATCFA